MTRDQTIATLILHGWEPYVPGGSIGGADVLAAIWNPDTRWTVRWAPPHALLWVKLNQTAKPWTCGWEAVGDNPLKAFENVYPQHKVTYR